MTQVSDNFGGAVAAASQKAGGAGVRQALKAAADQTGVDFGYLYDVAARESSLDPNARAKTSSATGLFQFIEQTWLAAVKTYGEAHGLGEEAGAIERTASGGYRVADPARRTQILNLRRDPMAASKLAAEMTLENKRILETKLGRAASPPELYAAHFLGPSSAANLLGATPDAAAASLAPSAARANRPIFYEGARAKSVSEVIAGFERTIGRTAEALGASSPTPLAPTTVAATFAAPLLLAAPSAPPPPAPVRSTPIRADGATSAPRFADLATREVDRVGALASRLGAFGGADPLAIMVLQMLDPTILGDGGPTRRNSLF